MLVTTLMFILIRGHWTCRKTNEYRMYERRSLGADIVHIADVVPDVARRIYECCRRLISRWLYIVVMISHGSRIEIYRVESSLGLHRSTVVAGEDLLPRSKDAFVLSTLYI